MSRPSVPDSVKYLPKTKSKSAHSKDDKKTGKYRVEQVREEYLERNGVVGVLAQTAIPVGLLPLWEATIQLKQSVGFMVRAGCSSQGCTERIVFRTQIA